MLQLTVSRVTALPGTLEANTIYLVAVDGDKVEMYVVGNTTAEVRRCFDSSAATAGGAVEVVADIGARDGLTLTENTMVVVEDASADPSVDLGAALYVYKVVDGSFSKLSEFESLDVVLQWANIQGGPGSSPTAIDNAVSNSHTHANKTELDKLGESGGNMTYDGTSFVVSGNLAW